ncbi:hypothetical protein F4778DRAFT_383775 [Xylariomycetidae sp. FL2044]|nr:hypothetical protein F4778DRAFT_383775 [Xylariomycetidae sp. FL2044]
MPTKSNEEHHVGHEVKRRHSGLELNSNSPKRTKSSHTAILESSPSSGLLVRVSDHQHNLDEVDIETQPSTADTVPACKSDISRDAHFASLYTKEIDFRSLGERDEAFAAVLKETSQLDFSDPGSVMQLTKTLLKVDFGLHIELPMDRLCPPVPNRHNYILWLKDLLDSSSPSYEDMYEPERSVMGLDIGTGASAIYPLLGCSQRSSWSFIATDVDGKSLEYARENVDMNELQDRIRLVERRVTDECLIPLDELGIESLHFVMTNPPFYSSEAELLELARQKGRPPNSVCTGVSTEMVCDGGEIEFVRRIIRESLRLRERVQWYTSMLGKQSSLDALIRTLKAHEIDNYAVTSFRQGNKTRRWALGWSLINRRPRFSAARASAPAIGKSILPSLTEMTIIGSPVQHPISELHELRDAESALKHAMDGLDLLSWVWDEQRKRGMGFSNSNVWSRAYRRRKARERLMAKETMQSSDNATEGSEGVSPSAKVTKCAFGFAVSINVQQLDAEDAATRVLVKARWLQGDDFAMFESFVGMLKKLISGIPTS